MRGTAMSAATGPSWPNGALPKSIRPATLRPVIANARCQKERKSTEIRKNLGDTLSIAGLASVASQTAERDLKIQSNQDSHSYKLGGTSRHWDPSFLNRCRTNRACRNRE
jgi:hypothetical protein